MKPQRVSFTGVTVILPEKWYDITDDLSPGSPSTLAKTDGYGALQFSVARYASGVLPSFTTDKLRNMLYQLFDQKQMSEPENYQETKVDTLFYVRGDHKSSDVFICAWYVSDGLNVAMISYTTEHLVEESITQELKESEAIVMSLLF